MSLKRILVCDDEAPMRELVQLVLGGGYEFREASDGLECAALARALKPDLVILDVMLPGRNGYEVLKELRRRGLKTPVLMLTAKGQVEDRVSGLDAGADDYLVKPFSTDELLARVRALLRRAQPRQVEVLRFQDVELVPSAREARRADEPLELTAREYELLELFLRHPRQVLTREQILQRVWGFDYLGDSNLVDVRIKYLRDKLEQGGRSRLIQTIRGAGYALRA
jgi:DNA-binding response OmpR family regulator